MRNIITYARLFVAFKCHNRWYSLWCNRYPLYKTYLISAWNKVEVKNVNMVITYPSNFANWTTLVITWLQMLTGQISFYFHPLITRIVVWGIFYYNCTTHQSHIAIPRYVLTFIALLVSSTIPSWSYANLYQLTFLYIFRFCSSYVK